MTTPSFLGIGAQRSGTSWLDGLLRTHALVYLPERRKEVHYFDEHYDRGPKWYASFFPDAEHAPAYAAVGEITPRYLFDPRAPERIARDLGEIPLLCILRDPVDRAFSQYGLTVRDEAYRGSFAEFVEEHPDALARGLYHRQLSRVLGHFPRERLCLLTFEESVRAPEDVARRVAAHLGVDPAGFRPEAARKPVNAGRRVRFARSYALACRLASSLRARDLDAPVNAVKRLGAGRWLGAGTALAPLPADQRRSLWEHFAADVALLERELDVDVGAWGPERL